MADAVNRSVRQLDLHTGVVSTPSWAPTPSFRSLDAPSGLALDGGHFYVADSIDNVVVAFDLRSKSRIQPCRKLERDWHYGRRRSGRLLLPAYRRRSGRPGNLFVTDNGGCTLRRIDIATSTVSTLAGAPLTCGTRDGVGANASFYLPFGIAANNLGDLFVSDMHNNTIRHVDASSAAVTTPVGTTKHSASSWAAPRATLAAVGRVPHDQRRTAHRVRKRGVVGAVKQ